MIQITPDIAIDESELKESFIRASGPGGQNVNKVATAVQLRFDAAASPSLPGDVRRRLARLAGRRMTKDGVLVIEARRFRSQERNRNDALDRLVKLIARAVEKPKIRPKTKPGPAAVLRRLEAKKHRSRTKERRQKISVSEQ